MKRPHAWFVFPFGENSEAAVRSLVAAHVGRPLLGLSTPLPGRPELSLVQVLTFIDPQLGYRHLLSDEACEAFRALALSLHAGFRADEQLLIAEVVADAAPVPAAFGAGQDELFLLAPTRSAPVVQRAIEELLEAPGRVLDPGAPESEIDAL